MADKETTGPGGSRTVTPGTAETGEPTVVVRVEAARPRFGWWPKLLLVALIVSVMANVGMFTAYRDYFRGAEPPNELYHSGSRTATARVAVIEVTGSIMPPYTERYLGMIERVAEDDDVKGLLLVVDSPGGLVADSHQIYHALHELREQTEKPIVVSMKRMAASGGLYIAMGAGPDAAIYAEPTCWTGSIGVIVPHYDLTDFGEKVGIGGTDPALKTGSMKDSLSPFRPLSDQDKEVWTAILDESYQRFLRVIAENRDELEVDDVRKLADGRIYTTEQAVANGLVDEVGFEDDALDALKQKLGLEDVRVVTYQYPTTIVDSLLGTAEATTPDERWRAAMESTVPRAMYYCSWAPFYAGR